MRVAMRGDLYHVSPFHCRRARIFWRFCVGFCLFGWVFCSVGVCFAFHDFKMILAVFRS